jgi:glycosyltransferase involved in cell wall biosynthesis
MKVSVIIPNFNHGKYLRQRIESVINQTHTNIEVIILDDCSTDNSKQIILEYADHPLVKEIIFNDTNSGSPFKQWKTGIGKATGEWLWIAESDDYADQDFVKILLSAAREKENVGLIYCDSRIVNEFEVSGQTYADIKNKMLKTDRWSNNYLNTGMDEIQRFVLPYGTINNTSAALFRRDILVSQNPFDIDFRFIGDKYTFLKVLARSNIVYVSQPLNYYRNPFTQKHFDKFIHYFYEHFLIFNWVNKSLNIPKKDFFNAFYNNTRSSVYRNWSLQKLKIYFRLFRINPVLLTKSVVRNLIAPFKNGH